MSDGLLTLWDPEGPAGRAEVVDRPEDIDRVPDASAVIVRVAGRTAGRARRALVATGRSVGPPLVVVPAGRQPEHVVTLDATLRWSGALLRLSERTSSLLAAVASTRVGQALAMRLAPSVALVGVPPGASPTWMGDVGVASTASRSTRTDATTATLRVGTKEGVERYVQVGLDAGGRTRVRNAERGLAGVGSTARDAGIEVPTAVAGPDGALTTVALAGECLATRLRRDPGRLESDGAAVVDALVRWNVATAAAAPTEAMAAGVAEAARRILEHDDTAGRWASAVASRLAAATFPGVAVHGDLTTWNVLVRPDGGVGLVDWESAEESGLPMGDCWYLLADLLVATGMSRVQAVEALADGTAPLPQPALDAVEGLRGELGISEQDGRALFRATWIVHAGDEIDRGAPGEFVAAVSALVQRSITG